MKTELAIITFQLLADAWAYVWTLDFAGLLFGTAGTLLLATKGRLAGWGFVAFLASNVGWALFARDHGHSKLLTQHLIFGVSSLVGVYVWLIHARLVKKVDQLFAAPYDTHIMEDEIYARFDGRNLHQLAEQYHIPPAEVLDIVITRPKSRASLKAVR